MKDFLKKAVALFIAVLIYAVGMSSWSYYQDTNDWNFASILALFVAVIIVTVPVMNYWEAKARRWVGVAETPKPESNEDQQD